MVVGIRLLQVVQNLFSAFGVQGIGTIIGSRAREVVQRRGQLSRLVRLLAVHRSGNQVVAVAAIGSQGEALLQLVLGGLPVLALHRDPAQRRVSESLHFSPRLLPLFRGQR